jgi:hypothetical protein
MRSTIVTMRDVAALAAGPPLVSIEIAGRFLGYGRAWAHELHRRGELPVRAHTIAGRLKIPVHGPGGLLAALDLTLADLATLDPAAGLPEPAQSITDPEAGHRDQHPPAA